MQNGVFVTGTDTNVGKTWVGQQLIKALQTQGLDVIPRKPIESGWSNNEEKTDAWKLANAANKIDLLKQICPYRFKQAISPVRAAQLEGQSIKLEELKQKCLNKVKRNQFLHVEGAGGFYSPITSDALNADLAQALQLPLLVIAEDRVGCINQILLTLEAAQARKIEVMAIFLNKISKDEPNSMNNQEDLEKYTKTPVLNNINKLVKIISKISANKKIV